MSLDTKQRSYKVVVLFNIRFLFDSADGCIQTIVRTISAITVAPLSASGTKPVGVPDLYLSRNGDTCPLVKWVKTHGRGCHECRTQYHCNNLPGLNDF